MRDAPRRRGRSADDLGLRRALGDRMLPLLVGAMVFLAALAGAGVVAARELGRRWQAGPGAVLTAQVPRPEEGEPTRLRRALDLLRADPQVASARVLDPAEMEALLRPWFGAGLPTGLPIASVIDIRLASGVANAPGMVAALGEKLAAVAPEATLDGDTDWSERLRRLAASVQACAWLALAVVAGVAALIVASATRGGLVARREAIAIAHGLGATDAYIAAHFARRATALALAGAMVGAFAALPVLLALAALAEPFADPEGTSSAAGSLAPWNHMPSELWLGLGLLPLAASAIGFATARATVRRWLRQLP